MQIESHQSIWFFWLLPVMVAFFIFFQRRRRLLVSHFMPLQNVSERVPQYAFMAPYLRLLFFLCTVFFMLVALLKPYSGVEMREIKRKGVDLYLLVDLSESMLAEDIKPSRLVRARMEIQDFMAKAKGDRIGLIGFAGDSFVFVPLTTDREALSLFVNELSTDDIPLQGTDIKGAIEKAVTSFKTQSQVSSKAIILMTDGEDSIGLDDAVLDDIQKLGIKVFVIGIGTAEGAPIPQSDGGYKNDDQGQMVLTRLNETALQELAVTTGGGYVRSVSGDLDLEEIYQRGIKKNFANVDFSSEQKKVPHYRFQFFLFLALIFLILEMLTTNRKKYWRHFFRFKKPVGNAFLLLGIFLLGSQPSYAKNPYSFEKGNAWYQKGDYPSALSQYEDLAKSHPDDAEVSYNLGNTYYQLQQYDKARTEFKKSLNAEDEKIRKQALYNLGNTEFRAKDYQAALDDYDKALKIDPDYTKAKLNYDFVKKMLEEQKKNQEQKQDSDQQKKQDDEKDSDEQKKDPSDQKQEQKNDSKQKDDPKQKENDAGKKESDPQKDEKQDGDQKEDTKDGDQKLENELQDGQKPDDKKEGDQKRPFDEKAAQWLDSLNDDPSQALKYMIQKQQTGREKNKKDW